MDKMIQYGEIVKQLRSVCKLRTRLISARSFGTEKNSNETGTNSENQSSDNTTEPQLTGFAKAFEKFSSFDETKNSSEESKPRTFASLLRHSAFIDLGHPEGKVVTGKIVHVFGNDLYIDFGWKFHCVCPKPKRNASNYIRGAIVSLKIKELELSTRFLGATTDLTLSEADCILLNLISSPVEVSNQSKH